jgi:hypothetical protein
VAYYVIKTTRTVPPVVTIGPLTKGTVAAARLRFSMADALFSVVAQFALTTAQRSTDLALRYRNWTNFHSPRMARTSGSGVHKTYKLRSDGKLMHFRLLRT